LGGAYDARHPEIFNDVEQARLVASVARAVAAIASGDGAPGSRVMLDIGAGTGNLTDKLLAHPGKVYASDVSSGWCATSPNGTRRAGRVFPVVLNGARPPPARDASVDLVGAYSVLHHVPDYLALVAEMVRVSGRAACPARAREGAAVLGAEPRTDRIPRAVGGVAREAVDAIRRSAALLGADAAETHLAALARSALDARGRPAHLARRPRGVGAQVEARAARAGCEIAARGGPSLVRTALRPRGVGARAPRSRRHARPVARKRA
jgi:SAM-dependent methyltransferase